MPESPEQLSVKKPQEDMEKKPEDLEMQPESGSETPEDLEKLAQEKIGSIEKELEGLNGSEKRIDGCNNSVNLPVDKLEEIKASSGVIEKLETIGEKGKSLKKAFEDKMRILLAGFMITVGSMDANIVGANIDSKIKSETKIEEVVKKSELNPIKTQEKILDEKENIDGENDDFESNNDNDIEKEDLPSVEDGKDKNVNEEEKLALECAEKLRSEQIQHYSSPEYLDRLKKELKGNQKEAKKDQEQVIENLKTVKIEALDLTDFLEKAFETKRGLVEGFYDDKDHKITFVKNYNQLINQLPAEERNLVKLSMEDIINHEFEHAATKLKTSQKANELLGSSYEKQGFLGLIKGERDEYLSHPAEMLARKKRLDKALEKLGIKRYGEEFTEEHFKKMMEAYKDGKFSADVDQFIERTKKNPKIFMQIFNEIARNEEEKENLSSLV